ncbi:TIGR03757 family integrating conjugative element protein [Pseudomonas sp. R3.Fl]|uniref:TIGR03757 family integrating conjugative element protein n=1 Tax=Pseudomonas TaxID=286 RepID=UPI00201D69E0|nr:TIGR03757 family integrating conjugative element protein [Pseudomonas sp. R3.Fl]MCL6692278.1 TIGR03757 family integrating conjugative element protein [Pseudomonas sp. R3.Fl]
MPSPFARPGSSRQLRLVVTLCGLLIVSQVRADGTLVITDSHHPVQAPADARIIELDRPTRIETELAARLPHDINHSTALIQQRLANDGKELRQRLGAAYQGVVEAWSLGITTLPAVVVDRHYVVYGEPDVAKAVALIEAHRGTQP